MNIYTIVTPDVGLPCTSAEATAIQELLTDSVDRDNGVQHGFQFAFEDGLGYLEAVEQGTWDELPAAALTAIGVLIQRAGKPFLECGVAFTGSRMVPGTHGGTAFRIMPDGSIVNRVETWP